MKEPNPKIYLLPNLMTMGNLFCGFTAILKIVEGALLQSADADAAADLFHTAIWFILGACFFDLLDGRLARLGGHARSSAGGQEDCLVDSGHRAANVIVTSRLAPLFSGGANLWIEIRAPLPHSARQWPHWHFSASIERAGCCCFAPASD